MKHVQFFVITLLIAAYAMPVPAQVSNPNTVLVKVNNEDILQSEIDFTMNYFVIPQYQAKNEGQDMPKEQQTQIIQSLINQVITEKLVLQKGREVNITLDEQILNTQFESVKTQRPEIPPAELKEFLHQKLLVQTIIQQLVTSKVTVTDDELRALYEERKDQFDEPEKVRASHILISVAPNASEADKSAARQKMNDILAKAQAGEDFAELAKQYSNCPTNQKGGDLGFFPRGIMVQPFEDVAFTLAEGAISDIVETPFGYHLIKVTGKTAERHVTFDDVRDRLRQDLLGQKNNVEAQKWISDLRTNASIEFMQLP